MEVVFKNIRDTKGAFHGKMGSIKDRSGMDLKKQNILRRGGKNTQHPGLLHGPLSRRHSSR